MLLHTGSESNMFPLLFFYTFRIKSLYSHLLKFFSFLFWTNTRSWLRCSADLKRRFHIWLVMPMVCARPECLNSELYFCQTISQKTSFEILFFIGFCIVYFVIIIRLLIKKTYIFDSLSVAITLCSNCYTFCGCNFRRLMTLWQRCSHLKDTQ